MKLVFNYFGPSGMLSRTLSYVPLVGLTLCDGSVVRAAPSDSGDGGSAPRERGRYVYSRKLVRPHAPQPLARSPA